MKYSTFILLPATFSIFNSSFLLDPLTQRINAGSIPCTHMYSYYVYPDMYNSFVSVGKEKERGCCLRIYFIHTSHILSKSITPSPAIFRVFKWHHHIFLLQSQNMNQINTIATRIFVIVSQIIVPFSFAPKKRCRFWYDTTHAYVWYSVKSKIVLIERAYFLSLVSAGLVFW